MQNQISKTVADSFVDMNPSATLHAAQDDGAHPSTPDDVAVPFDDRPAPPPRRATQDLSAAVQRVLAWHRARSAHH